MIKKWFLCCNLFLLTGSLFANIQACPGAELNTSPKFCASFKTAAECYCYPLPIDLCYKAMLKYHHQSLEEACKSQHYSTSPQVCIDAWNCYRLGGINSDGQLCSQTGKKCA